MSISNQQRAALGVVLALGEAIRDLSPVPSGHVFGNVIGQMSLVDFNAAIGALKSAGLIKEDPRNVLTWVA